MVPKALVGYGEIDGKRPEKLVVLDALCLLSKAHLSSRDKCILYGFASFDRSINLESARSI